MLPICSKAELTFLSRNRKLSRVDLHAIFVERFGRRDVTREQIRHILKYRGYVTRRGQAPPRYTDEELAFLRPRAGLRRRELAELFFQQFGRRVAPINLRWICKKRGWLSPKVKPGQTRLKYGYLEVWQESNFWKQWKLILWEDLVGPVPVGHVLVPINGDKLDHDPLNWMCLSGAMMNRLRQNGFFEAPPELKPTILARARLKQALEDRMGKRFR